MEQFNDLTVIIPFHNFPRNFPFLKANLKYLRDCQVLVIVVLDDLHEDEAKEVKKYVGSNSWIQVKEIREKSAAHARNLGIELTTTTWMLFLDCDDYLDIREIMNSFKDYDDVDLVVTQLSRVGSRTLKTIDTSQTEDLLSLASFPAFSRILYRRSFVDQVRFRSLSVVEDQVFLAELILKKPRLLFVPTVTYFYSIGSASQTSSQIPRPQDHQLAIELYREWARNHDHQIRRYLEIGQMRLLLTRIKRPRRFGLQVTLKSIWEFISLLARKPLLIQNVLPATVKGIACA